MASCSSAGRRTRRRRRASPGARSDAARRGGAVSRSPPRRGHRWTPHTSKTCSATPWRPSPRSIPRAPPRYSGWPARGTRVRSGPRRCCRAVRASAMEASKRRAAWTPQRWRLCGVEGTTDLQRLQAEGEDAGYVIAGCRACHAYVKELDRRERWNGGPPLLEDWGSPHLDVVARREGLVKPLPALLDLAAR